MKTIFECLENGGRAWCNDGEVFINDVANLANMHGDDVPFNEHTTDLSHWRLEPKEEPKEELDYVDCVPYVNGGYWCVKCPKKGLIKLSTAIDQADFFGYVWEDGEGKEYKDNSCSKWRDRDGCLRRYDYDDDCTIERCKAVRFRKG